jgi:hypothetical protein
MRRLSFILLTFFIFSWGISTGSKYHTAKPIHITNVADKTDNRDPLRGLTDVNMLMNTLNTNSTLEDEHIGFTGENSPSYTYYQRLEEIATDSELVLLTHHSNPKMRVYGMWALAKKNKKLALLQMKRLKHDQATVMYQSGCITMPDWVCALAARNFDTAEVKVMYKSKHHYLYAEVELR